MATLTGAPYPRTTFSRCMVKRWRRALRIRRIRSGYSSGSSAEATMIAETPSRTTTRRKVVTASMSPVRASGSESGARTGTSNVSGMETAGRFCSMFHATRRAAIIFRSRRSISKPGGCSKSCSTMATNHSRMNPRRKDLDGCAGRKPGRCPGICVPIHSQERAPALRFARIDYASGF